jgi:cellulose biosynthesis protein BcsQ
MTEDNMTICIFSPTGGAGVTTIAAQLAFSLAGTAETALLDIATDFGNISSYLGFTPAITANKTAEAISCTTPDVYKANAFPRRPKLKVFPNPRKLTTQSDFTKIIKDCSQNFRYTIIDLPHSRLIPTVNQTLDSSNCILLVGEYGWNSISQISKFASLSDFTNRNWFRKTKLIINKVEWLPKDVLTECHKNLPMPVAAEINLLNNSESNTKLKEHSLILEKGIKSIRQLVEGN